MRRVACDLLACAHHFLQNAVLAESVDVFEVSACAIKALALHHDTVSAAILLQLHSVDLQPKNAGALHSG